MSRLSDHRDAFHSLIAEAHGTVKTPPPTETVLPPGARWVTHRPRTEIKPRKNGPVSGFFADLCLS